MEIKEIKDKIAWEEFLSGIAEKTFLQSWNWGEFQKTLGAKAWRFGICENGELLAAAQVLKVISKRGTFLFVPHAPIACAQNQKSKILNTLIAKLKDIAKKEKCGFVRIAPVWERNEQNHKLFKILGFRQAALHTHPELTWQLNLEKPEKELLMQARKTTRYLIRLGLKDKNLKIEISQDPQKIEVFNTIYQSTCQRHNFVPFSLDYLKNEFLSFARDGQAAVFLAKYREEYVAGAVIIFWQGTGFYHQGASSQKYPKIPASYLLQWEAIREAKRRGCGLYNFWGIVPVFDKSKTGNFKFKIPNSKQIQNSKFQTSKNHPWYGLSLFKIGFGGYAKEYLETQDLPLSKRYWLTFVFEKARKLKRRL